MLRIVQWAGGTKMAWLLLLISFILGGLSAGVARRIQPPRTQKVPGNRPALSARAGRPDSQPVALAEVRPLVLKRQWKRVAARLHGVRSGPAGFLHAVALVRTGRCKEALPILADVKRTSPWLGPWIAVFRAECPNSWASDRRNPCVGLRGWWQRKCSYLEARWAAAQGRLLRAWRAVERARGRKPGIATSQVLLLQVSLAVSLGRKGKALSAFRELLVRFPRSAAGRRAEGLLRKAGWLPLCSRRRHCRPAAWQLLTCAERVDRIERLVRLHRYRAARGEIKEAGRGCWSRRGCELAYWRARSEAGLGRRRLATGWYQRAVEACDRQRREGLKVRALYRAAKGVRRLGRHRLARAYFRRIFREHPHHSYADDAVLKVGETYQLEGRIRRAREWYRRVLEKYPRGDMRTRALWRLLWAHYLAGRDGDVQRLAGQWEGLVWQEKGPSVACRIPYWLARSLERSGRQGEARATYRRILAACPLSYHAMWSIERLEQMAPGLGRTVYESLRPHDGAAWQCPGTVCRGPAWRRVRLLGRLGLTEEVLVELEELGLPLPRGKPRPGLAESLDARTRQQLWAAVSVLEGLRLWHRSHWVVRHLLPEYLEHPPRGVWDWKWRRAYPRAWPELVDATSKRVGVPAWLLLAVMREESAFNPRQVSWAGALGLMQLMPATGRRFLRQTGRNLRRLLFQPAENIEAGARYLRFLLHRYRGDLVLAVAAYNAGERRVDRWRRRWRHAAADEFVERIPFWETRHYTKRVLGSAFVYRVLAGAADPPGHVWRNQPASGASPSRPVEASRAPASGPEPASGRPASGSRSPP